MSVLWNLDCAHHLQSSLQRPLRAFMIEHMSIRRPSRRILIRRANSYSRSSPSVSIHSDTCS
ncbi:MAG: hypothetical protein ACLVC6_08310 [Alistipes ihumii]|uniref:hypothetical protein n=1 Tax=Alistipes ihumii TaxID=1470347 RepID=UPI00399AE8FD